MKQKLPVYLINGIFFTLVIVIAITVATIALTRKVNEFAQQYRQGITGAVVKEEIPILALTQGVITKVYVATGDEVKKGDTLVTMDNPDLRSRLSALEQFKDNASAQTEAQVAAEQLKHLTIIAPDDGIIGDVTMSAGSPADSLTRILTMYSNKRIRLLAELTSDEYQTVKSLQHVEAYNPRLNQSFIVTPDILSPSVDTPKDLQEKKIGLYFTFQDPKDATSLLNNEDLNLQLLTQTQHINKPIDYFVNFWNAFLGKPSK